MKKTRRLVLSLVVAIALLVSFSVPVFAANPAVAITVTAELVAITNTQATWGIGTVVEDDVVYFSATGSQDDDYSQIENTGNVAVDVEIQGTNIEGGDYDWTLAAAAGNQTYSLHANNATTPTVYDKEVKTSSYVDIITDLAADGTSDWSMKFVAPDEFNADDDGAEKAATITLVASKHT